MDDLVLLNWHSASRGETLPLIGVSTFINGLEVEVYTSDSGFRYLIELPEEHLRFHGVFIDDHGHQLVLENEERFYWRSLTEQEKEIVQLWWRNLPERQGYPDKVLRQIEDYLQGVSPGTMVTFLTKYGRKVRMTRQIRQTIYGEKWSSLHNRVILAKAAEDAVEFWVHNRREPTAGAGMSHQVFFTYITPRHRRAI